MTIEEEIKIRNEAFIDAAKECINQRKFEPCQEGNAFHNIACGQCENAIMLLIKE